MDLLNRSFSRIVPPVELTLKIKQEYLVQDKLVSLHTNDIYYLYDNKQQIKLARLVTFKEICQKLIKGKIQITSR